MLPTAEGAVRFANVDELSSYTGVDGNAGLSTTAQGRASGRDEKSLLRVREREAFEETIFLGLRMNEGVSVAALREAFPRDLVASCEEAARELIAEGLMIETGGRWQLTLRGRMVSNEVFGALLETVAV